MLTKTEKLNISVDKKKTSMDNENYISPNKITKQYDITSGTLRRWAENGKIRCLRPNGGKRIYNIEDINKMFSTSMAEEQSEQVEEQKNEKCIDSTVNVIIQNLESVNDNLKNILPKKQDVNAKQLETIVNLVDIVKQTSIMFS